jgi:hypothetical protein
MISAGLAWRRRTVMPSSRWLAIFLDAAASFTVPTMTVATM